MEVDRLEQREMPQHASGQTVDGVSVLVAALVDSIALCCGSEQRDESEMCGSCRLHSQSIAAVSQLQLAIDAMDTVVAPDNDKSLAARIRDEFADFQMVLDHCERAYDHFSRGRISKANTLPSEVFSVAEECAQEDIREETEELRAELLTRERAAFMAGIQADVALDNSPSGWYFTAKSGYTNADLETAFAAYQASHPKDGSHQ